MRIKVWVGMLAVLVLGAGAARADLVDDIQKRGEMVVGMEAAYQPFEYFKDGKIIGLDCEIAEKLAAKLGVKAKFVDTAWSGIIPSLYASKFDLIISGMTITKERAEKVAFTQPYAEASSIMLKRAGDGSIKAAADLSGKGVGTQLGSAPDVVAKKFEAKLKEQGKPGFSTYKLYEHFPEGYLDLTNKRIDAVIVSKAVALVLMKEQPNKYEIVDGIQEIKAFTGMALRKDDKRLHEAADGLLREMKADGSLAALQTKWFGQTFETPGTVPETLP